MHTCKYVRFRERGRKRDVFFIVCSQFMWLISLLISSPDETHINSVGSELKDVKQQQVLSPDIISAL